MSEHTDETAPVEEEHPRGTLAMMLFYLLVIVGLWVWTYGILLARN